VQALVVANVLPLPEALALVTTNPSTRLGLSGRKGMIIEEANADLIILDDKLTVGKVFCNGRLMVDGGRAIVKGRFEAQ